MRIDIKFNFQSRPLLEVYSNIKNIHEKIICSNLQLYVRFIRIHMNDISSFHLYLLRLHLIYSM